MASSKVYLITGCSSGLGYSLAIAALKTGHKVIATSRNPDKTPERVKEIVSLGGQWATLDVSSSNLEGQFHENVTPLLHNGRLDVLINNAGIGEGILVEDLDLASSHQVFETNFWGTVRLSRLAIPLMRAQSSGNIVNISSTNAVLPFPLLSIYSASKAALDGFTAALAGEVAHFGIWVLLVTPAGIRTAFIENSSAQESGKSLREEYRGTQVDALRGAFLDLNNFKIDPDKAAATVVAAVDGTGAFHEVPKDLLRLPLGADALAAMDARIQELTACRERFANVADNVHIAP